MSKVGGETSEADKEKSEGTSSAASVSAHVALKLLRPLNYYQFSQALQLFMLYGVQLAIFPFAAMSEFLLYVVHDTINKRGRPWQFAQGFRRRQHVVVSHKPFAHITIYLGLN